VGARHLLCSSHSFELEIRLHHPHRFLNPDYNVFDCGRVALGEAEVSVTIVAEPSPQRYSDYRERELTLLQTDVKNGEEESF
jgi:hypothetical protein